MDESHVSTRYFLEIKGARQFAITFKGGQPELVKHSTGRLTPNEVVFALGEEIRLGHDPGDPTYTFLDAWACQFRVNADGKTQRPIIRKVQISPVEIILNARKSFCRFSLDALSVKDMQRSGFNDDFPLSFKSEFFSDKVQVGTDLFSRLAVLPQHGRKKAQVIRDHLSVMVGENVPVKSKLTLRGPSKK